jgi:hypothetical protein
MPSKIDGELINTEGMPIKNKGDTSNINRRALILLWRSILKAKIPQE